MPAVFRLIGYHRLRPRPERKHVLAVFSFECLRYYLLM
jgi:hypothetical protein